MKIRELIKEQEKFDGEMPVTFRNMVGGLDDINYIWITNRPAFKMKRRIEDEQTVTLESS